MSIPAPRWAVSVTLNAFFMSRTRLLLVVPWALLLLPISLWSQKSTIKEEQSPSGKQEIRSQTESSPPSKAEEREERNTYVEPVREEPRERPREEPREEPRERPRESRSQESPAESTPSYSAPQPSYSEPKTSYSQPSNSEPRPRRGKSQTHNATQASAPGVLPSPQEPGSAAEGHAPQGPATGDGRPQVGGRVVVFDDGEATIIPPKAAKNTQAQPTPQPMPLGPHDARGVTEGNATFVGFDSLPPHVIHGVVLSAPARPNYQILLQPKPITGMTPVQLAPKPKPPVPPQTGGSVMLSSDPYNDDTDQTSPTTSYDPSPTPALPVTWLAPELACIYIASDSLVSYFRSPSWCTGPFNAAYRASLQDYAYCFKRLQPSLVEAWMWPCYLTFADEFNFWAEECYDGKLELMQVRDYLRNKAIMVPDLMVALDVQNRADWAYIDTAFAAPAGGQNYEAAMRRFNPSEVLQKLRDWVVTYPTILEWPAYVSLQDFFIRYPQGDMWLMLRTKADLDYKSALDADDPQAGRDLAENAAWICLALEQADSKSPEIARLKNDIKTYLRRDAQAWQQSALRTRLD
jgi:hypothetical protein